MPLEKNNTIPTSDDGDGPNLRSSVEDFDDWVVDHDSYEMNQTKERYLSCYAMEQLWVEPDKTKLLLLVKVDDDGDMFGGKASAIDAIQNIERTTISGKEYYRLKCTITNGNKHLLVDGIKTKQYSMSRFESDFANRRGGIGVMFDGTNECHHFLWNTILHYPSSFLFVGASLSRCRSFDSIFNDCRPLSNIHHRFLSYYHEFEGDVQACLALYNTYLHKRSYILAQQVGKLKRAEKKYDKKYLNQMLFSTS